MSKLFQLPQPSNVPFPPVTGDESRRADDVIAAVAASSPARGERDESYRQRLMAANRALDGRVVNETAKGVIEGVAVAGLFVVGALFGAEVAIGAGVVALGVAFFRGRR